jgi:YbbR domain-containing protein
MANGSYRIVALIISLILWITVLGQKGAVATKDVNVELVYGKDVVVTNDVVRKAAVRLIGSRMALKKLGNDPMTVMVDLEDEQGRQIVEIPRDRIQLPLGVKVESISPPSLTVVLEAVESKMIPVHVRWQKEKKGYKVAAVEPREVLVKGARSALEGVTLVSTEKVDFSKLTDSGDGEIVVNALLSILGKPGILPIDDRNVQIKLEKVQ